MTVAVSYHQFLAYKNDFNLDARRIISLASPVFPSVNATVDFKGQSFSGAVGYAVAPKIKIGGAVSFNRLDASVDALRNNTTNFSGDPFCGATACTLKAAKIPSTEIHDTPSAIGYTGGVLIQPFESFTIGAVAAIEPHFTMNENVKAGDAYPGQPAGESWTVPFNMPSHFGAGAGWRLNDRTLTAFDVVYTKYSDLVQNSAQVVFRHPESFTSVGIVCAPTNPTCLSTAAATVPNGVDIHAGLEFLIVKAPTPIFIRYGFERLASHIVTAGSCPIPFGPNFNDPAVQQGLGQSCTLQSQLYAGVTQTVGQTDASVANGTASTGTINLNSAELGYSAGAGFVIGPRAQIDAAFVHTSYHRTDFIVSMAVRF